MSTEAQRTLEDDTYKALGRFVAAFSGVLYSLETSTIRLFEVGPDETKNILFHAALANRTAEPIVSSFFSVFFKRWEGLVTQEDSRIMKRLRGELDDLVKMRNRLMHDAWMSTSVGGDPGPHPPSRLRVRAHGTGAEYEVVSYHPSDINSLTADALRLSSVINASVWYSRPGQTGPELHTRLCITNGKVARREVQPEA